MYTQLDANNCGFGEENIDEDDNGHNKDMYLIRENKDSVRNGDSRSFSSRFEQLYDTGLEKLK